MKIDMIKAAFQTYGLQDDSYLEDEDYEAVLHEISVISRDLKERLYDEESRELVERIQEAYMELSSIIAYYDFRNGCIAAYGMLRECEKALHDDKQEDV